MAARNISRITLMVIALAGSGFASDTLFVPRSKSPATGVWISVAATAAPVGIGLLMYNQTFNYIGSGVMLIGPAFGPSAGHFYAHQWGAGCLGFGLRLGLAGATFFLAYPWLQAEQYDISSTIALVGIGLIVFESIIEIASVPASVRNYNTWLIKKSQLDLQPRLDLHNRSFGIKISYHL